MKLSKRQEKTSAGDYEILSLTRAKAYLYVTASDQDDVIQDLINSAVAYLEQALDFYVDTDSTIYQYYDGFGKESYLPIWHRHIDTTAGSTVVEYWDGSEWMDTFEDFRLNAFSMPPRVALNDDASWPTPATVTESVRVGFKVNTSAPFYNDLKRAVMTLVAAYYENREMSEVPPSVTAFIDMHRLPA